MLWQGLLIYYRKQLIHSHYTIIQDRFILSELTMITLPVERCKTLSISSEGYQRALQADSSTLLPGQNFIWTDDPTWELPIRIGQSSINAIPATTVIEEWKTSLKKYGSFPAMSVKRQDQWVTISFGQYYNQCIRFALSLLTLGLPDFSTVSIHGLNSPEWQISYFGIIFAKAIPMGVYQYLNKNSCECLISHSRSRVVIAQSKSAEIYYDILDKGQIDLLVVYGESLVKNENPRIMNWQTFLSLGRNAKMEQLERKTNAIKAGNCCSIIYTSGTTGQPKGVMLSHDNFIWNVKAYLASDTTTHQRQIIINYSLLAFVSAQFNYLFRALINGDHLYFVEPTDLHLLQNVKEVRPQRFYGGPKIWLKIYEALNQFTKKCGPEFQQLAAKAKQIGIEGTIKEAKGDPLSPQFLQAKVKVFNKFKEFLGLDRCNHFVYGSGPLDPVVRQFFISSNIFLRNAYGMTESTGPAFATEPLILNLLTPEDYMENGCTLDGTETKIQKMNEGDQEGEICMRGRHVFMGYLRDAKETAKTIDSEGFLHSEDLGRVNKEGVFFVTGRLKEILMPSSGGRVIPIILQNQITNALPCISSVMAVGDKRKYIICLISIKKDPNNQAFEASAASYLQEHGCKCKTVEELSTCPDFSKIVFEGLDRVNQKGVSPSYKVKDFYLMPEGFSVSNGTLTPTLKLKRKEVLKKYAIQIDHIYEKSNI